MNLQTRLDIERRIVNKAVDTLLDQNYLLSVHDGEVTTVRRSNNASEIKAALRTTDMDQLIVHNACGQRVGWLRFVYGNDGFDVLADYTTNLEGAIAPINEYARDQERLYS